MSEPKRVAVVNCCLCPFGWDGRDIGDVWRCTASDLGTEFSEIRSFRRPWKNEVPAPPRWCPLRKADHLVTLVRVK